MFSQGKIAVKHRGADRLLQFPASTLSRAINNFTNGGTDLPGIGEGSV